MFLRQMKDSQCVGEKELTFKTCVSPPTAILPSWLCRTQNARDAVVFHWLGALPLDSVGKIWERFMGLGGNESKYVDRVVYSIKNSPTSLYSSKEVFFFINSDVIFVIYLWVFSGIDCTLIGDTTGKYLSPFPYFYKSWFMKVPDLRKVLKQLGRLSFKMKLQIMIGCNRKTDTADMSKPMTKYSTTRSLFSKYHQQCVNLT